MVMSPYNKRDHHIITVTTLQYESVAIRHLELLALWYARFCSTWC